MRDTSFEFLKRLLDAPGPSGFETIPVRLWRAEAENFVQGTQVDVLGNAIATLNPGGSPRIMLAGHVDEIGLMITHIDDDGLLYLDGIGGWDPQVLVGQRIRVLGRTGEVMGVIGKKPIHLIKPDEREKASKLTDLWIDVGAENCEAAKAMGLRVGDPAVIDARLVELGGRRIASRSVDNRIGAWVVLEALRMLAESGNSPAAQVSAVATTQEEIGYQGGGARTSAFVLEPDVAIVVDVTFATDVPGIEKKQVGEHKLGSGPVLGRGSASHPGVFERLAETAEAEGIPYTIEARPKQTSTDADAIHVVRGGVATANISVPNRYMHSPNEVVSLDDLDATVRLIAAFCTGMTPDVHFTRG
ncbi:MAG: M42 family metallopeptidase [Gemmatimonadota bacterium]|nr:M42 family metallopeptidase [Gemmatimonadota bacterium]